MINDEHFSKVGSHVIFALLLFYMFEIIALNMYDLYNQRKAAKFYSLCKKRNRIQQIGEWGESKMTTKTEPK